MSRRRALLFDLDHTLFDTPKTERRALRTVTATVGVPFGKTSVGVYQEVNLHVWSEYRAGRITSKELRVLRFKLWLERLGITSHDPSALGRLYLSKFQGGGDLIAGALAAIRAAQRAGIRLGVVTNGIDRVQRNRLRASGLSPYFGTVVTSERARVTKPDPRIMEIALRRLRVSADEAIYVGDDPAVDGLAANRASVRFAWFNPSKAPRPTSSAVRIDHELTDLREAAKLIV